MVVDACVTCENGSAMKIGLEDEINWWRRGAGRDKR
jgi:hypothetical protein